MRLDLNVLADHPTKFLELLLKGLHLNLKFHIGGICRNDNANAPQTISLLRVRHERPSGHRTAEKRDELAPPHRLPPRAEKRTLAHGRSIAVLRNAAKSGAECPLRVKSRHSHRKKPCPICPRKADIQHASTIRSCGKPRLGPPTGSDRRNV